MNQNVRRYESVPIGTLLTCLAAWSDLLYSMEYWKTNSIARQSDAEGELKNMIVRDKQDIMHELFERNLLVQFDTIKNEYTAIVRPYQSLFRDLRDRS